PRSTRISRQSSFTPQMPISNKESAAAKDGSACCSAVPMSTSIAYLLSALAWSAFFRLLGRLIGLVHIHPRRKRRNGGDLLLLRLDHLRHAAHQAAGDFALLPGLGRR